RIATGGCEAGAPYLLTPRGEAGLYGARTSHPLADPACDVWRHGRGLGKGGWRAWLTLDPPATTREIQRRLGVGVRAAQQRLARLAEHGLAARDAEGVWHRLEPDAGQVAARLGTAGTGRRQRWRHVDEREVHAKALAFFRWERQQRGRGVARSRSS